MMLLRETIGDQQRNIERGIDDEKNFAGLVAVDGDFGFHRGHAVVHRQRETFARALVLKRRGIVDAHGLPAVVELHHRFGENVVADRALVGAADARAKVAVGHRAKFGEVDIDVGQVQHGRSKVLHAELGGALRIDRRNRRGGIEIEKRWLAEIHADGKKNQVADKLRRHLRGVSAVGESDDGGRRRGRRRRTVLRAQVRQRRHAGAHECNCRDAECSSPLHQPSRCVCVPGWMPREYTSRSMCVTGPGPNILRGQRRGPRAFSPAHSSAGRSRRAARR